MSRPFCTTELRWFFEGSLPAAVDDWFQRLAPTSGPPSSRQDFYLCLPERDSLGVKLREGNIEVKQRYGAQTTVRLAGDVAGQVEQWRKWSYALAEPESAVEDVGFPPGAWVGVGKSRRLQKYTIGEGQVVQPAELAADMTAACDLELAQIEINNAVWWSICLEAYGPEEQVQDQLLHVAEYLFAGAAPRPLPLENSFGYARLLQIAGKY